MRYLSHFYEILYSHLPHSVKLKYDLKKFMRSGFNAEMWGGGIYSENLEKALKRNLTTQELNNKKYVEYLKKDIVKSYIVYEATPEEYFAFEFKNKSISQRKKYLTNMTKDKILISKVGWPKLMRLRDKLTTYSLLSDFFMRDVCCIRSENDRVKFNEFFKKHNRYFVKPIDGMCGKNADIMTGNGFDMLLSNGEWIVEELITQVPEMAQFNPSSINTVRLPSFYESGDITVLSPFFRTGRLGAIVDNGGAGGVFSAIDAASGQIVSDGYSEENKKYIYHPDSGVKFCGFQIPKWQDLLSKAKEAHCRLPDQKYIAWDFALTPKGWVIVEANSMGQFLAQYATKIGIREEFLKLMD